jgi:hypothetical protein
MNTLAKIVQLIADIGECEELNMTLESVVINLTNLKSALSQPKKEVSDLVLEEQPVAPEQSEEDNIKLKTLYLRKKVILDLQSNYDKPRNWFAIVLLELKQKMKKYKNTGKMYKYEYVFATHPRIRSYLDFIKPNKYSKKVYQFNSSLLTEFTDHPIVKYCVESYYLKTYAKWENIEPSTKILDDCVGREDIFKYMNEPQHYKSVPEDLRKYLIKIRLPIGSMDLTLTPTPYYSIINLKHWNKTTKKTSNKGLRADHTYSWVSESGYRWGGWRFGGISADDLWAICKKNGFVEEKKKKYNYGDYAEWYMKL